MSSSGFFRVFVWLLAASAGAYEMMETVCQIGRKKLTTTQACADKAADMADGGGKFSVKVRADSPDVLSAVLAFASQLDDYAMVKTDPLMTAAQEGYEEFSSALAKSIQEGKIQGWQVGESVGSVVGKLAGGATLGSLGFFAGSVAGFTVGATVGTAAALPPAALFCSLFPPSCPYMAASVGVSSLLGAAEGAVLGGSVGAYAGVRIGAECGSQVGGLVGGFIGQEIGGAINYAQGLHGLIYQLPAGLVLAIDYAVGDDGAAKALSYNIVFTEITN